MCSSLCIPIYVYITKLIIRICTYCIYMHIWNISFPRPRAGAPLPRLARVQECLNVAKQNKEEHQQLLRYDTS